MKVDWILVIGELFVLLMGMVALYLGGIWADEHQAGGAVSLWLVPLAGVALVVIGVVMQSRRRSASN